MQAPVLLHHLVHACQVVKQDRRLHAIGLRDVQAVVQSHVESNRAEAATKAAAKSALAGAEENDDAVEGDEDVENLDPQAGGGNDVEGGVEEEEEAGGAPGKDKGAKMGAAATPNPSAKKKGRPAGVGGGGGKKQKVELPHRQRIDAFFKRTPAGAPDA